MKKLLLFFSMLFCFSLFAQFENGVTGTKDETAIENQDDESQQLLNEIEAREKQEEEEVPSDELENNEDMTPNFIEENEY